MFHLQILERGSTSHKTRRANVPKWLKFFASSNARRKIVDAIQKIAFAVLLTAERPVVQTQTAKRRVH